jgi:SAM-dependent methyltransferase
MTFLAVDLVDFPSRADRVRYLNERFGALLTGRVLDVGCDVRTLSRLRPDLDYLGIDAGGEPDLTVDLESGPLPFPDASFDVVVCSDVLEHLDNLHDTFRELVRVARGRLIVSLPNCWAAARRPLHRGKGAIGHYGLPSEPPADRHKLFFSLSEGRRFAVAAAERHALRIAEMRASEKVRPALVRWARRLRHPRREHYLNLYAHTLWVVFEKGS